MAQKKNKALTSEPPAEPKPPTESRLLIADITVEKVAVAAQENPLGLLLIRDELTAWLKSFDRYAAGGKGSDSPTWLSLNDADSIMVDRKSATGSIFAERAAVSLFGTIQPGILRRVFGDAERESGLLGRMLLVQPPEQLGLWSDAELSDTAAAGWDRLLRSLMEIAPDADEHGNPRPRMIPLCPEAKAAFIPWHDAHKRETAEISDEHLRSHFGKLKGHCIRFALLFTCVDAVTGGGAVAQIGVDAIEQAIVVTEWFKNEARRVYGGLAENEDERDIGQLVEWVRRRGGSATPRDLQRSGHQYKRAEDATLALEGLVKAGLGTWEQLPLGAEGGRPSKVFRLREPLT